MFSCNYSAIITEVFGFSLGLWKNSQHWYCLQRKVIMAMSLWSFMLQSSVSQQSIWLEHLWMSLMVSHSEQLYGGAISGFHSSCIVHSICTCCFCFSTESWLHSTVSVPLALAQHFCFFQSVPCLFWFLKGTDSKIAWGTYNTTKVLKN